MSVRGQEVVQIQGHRRMPGLAAMHLVWQVHVAPRRIMRSVIKEKIELVVLRILGAGARLIRRHGRHLGVVHLAVLIAGQADAGFGEQLERGSHRRDRQ